MMNVKFIVLAVLLFSNSFAASSLTITDSVKREDEINNGEIKAAIDDLPTDNYTELGHEIFTEGLFERDDEEDPKEQSVQISDDEEMSENGFFLLSSGLPRKHSDFQLPYFSQISRSAYFNLNPEYSPFRFEDLVNRNDENGAGISAAGLCCSPTYGSYGKEGMRLFSMKSFDKFGRGDPFAFFRSMNAAAIKIIKNDLKRVTILIATPNFIHGTSNHGKGFKGNFQFQRRMAPVIEIAINSLIKKVNLLSKGKREILFVLPAGDFNKDLCTSYFRGTYKRLSENDNVMIVSALDQTKLPREFSILEDANYGNGIVNTFIGANGLETWEPVQSRRVFKKLKPKEDPMHVSGSRPAAAIAAGAAHRIFEDNPEFTAKDVKEEVIKNYGFAYPYF